MKDLFKAILYQPLYNLLIFITWLIPGHNIGWTIIVLTLIIRIILMPSSAKSTRAQKDMKKLAPLLADIKKKYAGDRQGEATATMELYKEHGVSPWGSCLPLLIQLPILWILYRVFMIGLDTNRYDLLYSFTPAPDVINTVWLGIDLSQPDKWILPILAGLAQLLQSWQMKQLNPTPAPSANKSDDKAADFSNMLTGQMMYIMPIFTVIIAMRLPAALALYWFVTTLFMVAQTWWIMRGNKPKIKNQKSKLQFTSQNEKTDAEFSNNNKIDKEEKPKPKKQSKLMDRLADRATRYKGRKDVTVEIRRKS